jgi:DNA polymerase-1
MITVDFETEGIEAYPKYPPKPVGVSIWDDADKPEYFSWGHPTGNNTTYERAKVVLEQIWDKPLLFHNGRFDTEVARVHFGLPMKEFEDTLFLNYLYDPNAETLSLKPSSERILGIPPDEKNNLDNWLIVNGFKPGRDICKAPAELVAPYANGDTFRTRRLYDHLLPIITDRGMLEAYKREQRLAVILNDNERDGIRVDTAALERDLAAAELTMAQVNLRLIDLIGLCNFDSSVELASALVRSGRVKESDFKRTPTGKLSTAKASLDGAVKDPELRDLLGYRGNLKTLLTTFMRPWVELSTNGRLHPSFNQVRGDIYGTRTGRLSSSNPNFQNIPTEFKGHPPAGLPALPFMRRYILPDEGHVLVSSDFNGQEMRIAAHFAEGRAAEIYRNDPRADFHAAVAQIIEEDAGLVLDRKMVKITGFSLIYGSGINSLAELLGVDKGTAANIRKHYFQALPGFKELMEDVSARGRAGLAVKTWGGRLLHAEKAKLVNGQTWTFEYKLLNYLIQGSAADQTKEAINSVGYWSKYCRFLATVHDENVYSIDPAELSSEVEVIKASMEDQKGWDVPFKAEVKVGPNWWDIVPSGAPAKS